MSKWGIKWVIGVVILGLLPGYSLAEERVERYEYDVKINQEAPEVGKKRLEILEKALSPALIERRRDIVRQFEADYNQKISRFLQEVTTANSKNTVITHVDIHLFDPNFKEQIEVEKDVSVSAILGRSGFDLWKRDQPEEQALEKLRQLISGSFRIPAQRVTLVVGP